MKFVVVGWMALLVACSGSGASPSDASAPDASHVTDAAADTTDAVPQEVPDPGQSSLATDRDSAIAGVDTVAVTVTLRDAAGQPLSGASVDFVASGAGNTISPAAPTDASGTTTVSWSSMVAEAKVITASVGTVQVATHTVMFAPGPATSLAFVVQPSSAIAGAPFTPALEVAAVDMFGNTVPTVTGYVQLSLASNPTATTVRGYTFASFTGGIATFSNAYITVAATGYALQANTPGLTAAISADFDITPGPPDPAHSSIDASPASLDADGTSAALLTVHVANPYGVALANIPVSLSVSGSNNTLAPTSGMTSAAGTMTASLSSTTPELKTVTADVGTFTVTTQVHFYPLGCTPQLPGPPWMTLPHAAYSMITADVDGDGKLDAVISEADVQIEVYRGRGDGTFQLATAIPTSQEVYEMTVGDFNHDGHLDLVYAPQSVNGFYIALGTGGGQFATPTMIALPNSAYSLATGDFDRNGTLDLALNVSNLHEIVIESGTGTGGFTTGTTITNIDVTDIVVVDLNGDGKLDLLDDEGAINVRFGDGAGGFAAPVRTFPASSGPLFTGDFNGDGKLDVIVGDYGSVHSLLGNGDGTFHQVGGMILLPDAPSGGIVHGAGIADLDGDGKVDLVVESSGTVSFLKGGGDGSFTFQRAYASGWYLTLADIDGDGIRDALTTGSRSFGIIKGQAGGAFVAPGLYPFPGQADHAFASTGDFDGNGQLDVMVEHGSSSLQAQLTASDGSLTAAATVGTGGQAQDLVVEDYTGDGRADVIAAYGFTLRLGAGNGDGTFQPLVSQTLSTPYVTSLAAANLDGDARQDLVLTSFNSTGFWLTSAQANGTFGPLIAVAAGTHSVVVKDVSGDGISDILTTDMYGDLAVYKGNGSGGVLAPVSYPTGGMYSPPVIGDVDGDGTLDVVMLHEDSITHVFATVVMRGLGGGAFGPPIVTPSIAFPADTQWQDVRLADLTGDGVLDVEVSTSYGFAVLGGYGDDYFRQHPKFYGFATYTGVPQEPTVAIFDRNRDAHPDLTFGTSIGTATALYMGCR